MKNISHFIILLVCFIDVMSLNAEEATSNQQAEINFAVKNEVLALNNSADEPIWIDLNQEKHLILKYLPKGRKERGNVLLLHTDGENADHPRLIRPLAKQLSRLGWTLFIPNIAQADLPTLEKKTNKDSTLTDNEPTATEETSNDTPQAKQKEIKDSQSIKKRFINAQQYQTYFSALCKAIFEQTTIKQQPSLIIANQNSAYWSLECLQLAASTPVVLLQPQLPTGVENDLESRFSNPTNPIFSFRSISRLKNAFSLAFEKRIWRSKQQRFNVGMLSNQKLEIEDNNVAKTISGWIDRQSKKAN